MKQAICSSYRLQLHQNFNFNQARDIIPYLSRLGISHVYSSPFFRATPGSLHGYDVCDHNEINPEIGTIDDLRALVRTMREHQMKLIVDFVPNHMGISDPGNYRWMDVLENGPASTFARYFDIEWHPTKQALDNKVLLPILGDQYGRMLEAGGLQLHFDASCGRFSLHVHDTWLPLATRSTIPLLKDVADRLQDTPNELLSIIYAIEHLPPRIEASSDPIAIEERTREKAIIHERLQKLCESEPGICRLVSEVMEDWNAVQDEEHLQRLDELLAEQPYRLSYWKVAAEEINYRRFFDVNTLAAIRIDLPEVFEETHRLLFELVDEGLVDGVRIDHIDGLAMPTQYLELLRQRMPDGVIYVEKILGADEQLPGDWPIEGTTGYEFAIQTMNVLLQPTYQPAMTRTYERFLDGRQNFREIVRDSKMLIMRLSLASEINMLGTLLSRLAESHRWYRDFTLNSLTRAIREVVASFPVYRSYVEPGTMTVESDVRAINFAISHARRLNPALERSVFEFLRTVLLGNGEEPPHLDEQMRWSFVRKFQQCTGPITAKGIEDTAFYRYNRLIALNEVGGEPDHYGMSVDAYHQHQQQRLQQWPSSMLATSTHDTKRSQDVRSRILALSELAPQWSKTVKIWKRLNRKQKLMVDGLPAPDANEEYYLYQTLVGSWPLHEMDEAEWQNYVQRIQEHMIKALHEAKINSSWIDPNQGWDEAVVEFVARILSPKKNPRFMASLREWCEQIAPLGAMNSLSQTLLKLTVPGVPDIYQGTETWNFSLVDPDNRRPVDFEEIQQLLLRQQQLSPAEMLEDWKGGAIKMMAIHRLLKLRQKYSALFAKGDYQPVQVSGKWRDHIIAFTRQSSELGVGLLVVVPRFSSALGQVPFPVGDVWEDTALHLSGDVWRNGFTDQTLQADGALRVANVFSELPFAVLVGEAATKAGD